MASAYYKPCKEFDICNELIEKYWETSVYKGYKQDKIESVNEPRKFDIQKADVLISTESNTEYILQIRLDLR